MNKAEVSRSSEDENLNDEHEDYEVNFRSFAGIVFEDIPPDWAGTLNLDELCQTLLGLPFDDAEEEVRDALRKVTGEALDADTLGVLLRVFRLARESALQGYDSWDSAIEYSNRLTRLCDRNFLGVAIGEPAHRQDFPPLLVAGVYAECGRTLALAGLLSAARDKLQKALNIFGVLKSSGSEELPRQVSATHATLARVLRRLGQPARAQDSFLQALQGLAELTETPELAGLVSEYCEVVTEVGKDAVISSALVGLIAELAEDKLSEGSDAHKTVLRQLADTCVGIGRLDLAAPALVTRAKLLREECQPSNLGTSSGSHAGSGRGSRQTAPSAWAEADAQAAEEEAAQALEAAAVRCMEDGDLEEASRLWEDALTFRELLEDRGSELVASMQISLEALRRAAAAQSADDVKEHQLPTDGTDFEDEGLNTKTTLEAEAEEEESNGMDEEDEKDAADASAQVVAQPSHLVCGLRPLPPGSSSLTAAGLAGGLRPSWAQKRESEQRILKDSWED